MDFSISESAALAVRSIVLPVGVEFSRLSPLASDGEAASKHARTALGPIAPLAESHALGGTISIRNEMCGPRNPTPAVPRPAAVYKRSIYPVPKMHDVLRSL